MTEYLGVDTIAGGMMKDKGTTQWRTPNKGANNSSGFTALPGGFRGGTTGCFEDMGYNGTWWTSSSSSYPIAGAWMRKLSYSHSKVNRYGYYKNYGFSVRCVMDN